MSVTTPRLQESGLPVYGFGEKKTPSPFVQACTSFIYVENLMGSPDDEKAIAERPKKKTRNELRGDTSLVRLLRTAADQTADDDGWSNLGNVGDYIRNNSSFSAVNYGYQKLGDLIRVSELLKSTCGLMEQPCSSANPQADSAAHSRTNSVLSQQH